MLWRSAPRIRCRTTWISFVSPAIFKDFHLHCRNERTCQYFGKWNAVSLRKIWIVYFNSLIYSRCYGGLHLEFDAEQHEFPSFLLRSRFALQSILTNWSLQNCAPYSTAVLKIMDGFVCEHLFTSNQSTPNVEIYHVSALRDSNIKNLTNVGSWGETDNLTWKLYYFSDLDIVAEILWVAYVLIM